MKILGGVYEGVPIWKSIIILLYSYYTGVGTGQLVALSSLGKWQQTLLSVQFLRLQKSTSDANFSCEPFIKLFIYFLFCLTDLWKCGAPELKCLFCYSSRWTGKVVWGSHIQE